MILEMKVPSPGESISEVEIAEWLVEDGDYVEKDQSIAEIDSDKATLELPAEESGIIKILVESGETVNIGETVCTIDTSKSNKVKIKNINNTKKEEPEEDQKLIKNTIEKQNKSEIKTTPLAKSIIEKDSLNISQFSKKDKIKKSDLANKTYQSDNSRNSSVKKMTTLRKKIAARLVEVKSETAMLTTFNEIDMSAILEIRKKYKEKFKEKYGVSLGFMSFFTKATTYSLLEFKNVNSMLDEGDIISHDFVDIAIAVSAPKGLMVPVLRNTELMSFSEIELKIRELAIKARDGKISIEEMTGGTFTITNGGVFGSMLSTPIINPPQSAILGMHNIVERPVVINGKIEIKPIMYVALSYDHRIIDGKDSVGFLCRIKELLENPSEELMLGNIKKTLNL